MSDDIKHEIQLSAHATWTNRGRRGTVAAGTGFGKSRLAVMEVERMHNNEELSSKCVLLVSPTRKLRDENWPNEFKKWNGEQAYQDFVKGICFASLKNEKGNHYKLVILDEVHRLTDMNAAAFSDDSDDSLTSFFTDNLCDAVMGLTATVPDEPPKIRLLAQIAPVIFTYTLDQGVADGMIADYSIYIIRSELDAVTQNIKGGTKAKPFMTTEAKHNKWIEGQIMRYRILSNNATVYKDKVKFDGIMMGKTFARNRFIASLPSKTALAKRCVKQIHSSSKRTLVFCGSIAQCNELGGSNVYHSESDSEAYNKFNAGEINILFVVDAANEGSNFWELDQILIVQGDSKERKFTQRVGRCLRTRPGHKAAVFVICVVGTADERWLNKSLAGFDQSKITYHSAKSVPQ